RRATGDDRVLPLSTAWTFSMESCRRHVLESVIERFGVDHHGQPPEVDVVGFSMGGLVARYAALPPRPEHATDKDGELPTLRIARLFTVATPHRGAQLAPIPPLHARVVAMRPGSEFLSYLDTAGADAPAVTQPNSHDAVEVRLGYPIVAYGVTPDHIVGAASATPSDRPPHWIDPPLVTLSPHISALKDPRVAADLILRLVDQPPLTTDPPAPLPD
ncbi:MAG: hypothetical protein AAF612_12860, partial [Planctomycetota bacterium]